MPGIGVNADDLVLDLLGVAGELLFKVGVAHYLRVGFQRVRDLLLVAWGKHGARRSHAGKAEGQGGQHDSAGKQRPCAIPPASFGDGRVSRYNGRP